MSKRIETILQNRDNCTVDEAREQVNFAREMISDAIENGDFSEVEDIMYGELGLELDYVFDLI